MMSACMYNAFFRLIQLEYIDFANHQRVISDAIFPLLMRVENTLDLFIECWASQNVVEPEAVIVAR